MTIDEIHNQLTADVEATESFLLAALSRGDKKAVKTWQTTLDAAKEAEKAIAQYEKVLKF